MDYPRGKLITCLVPDNGMAVMLIVALKERHQLLTADFHRCRGYGGAREPGGTSGDWGCGTPMCVVTVVVGDDRAEEVFEFLGAMVSSRLRGGNAIIHQGRLSHVTRFELPVGVPDEQEK
ncbi:MAG: hypothetical protein HQL84_08680 [Magnetococcales bacterium]|nr:hypothetical protein [Magnetococcales bacterium]MBF0150105.1 hypothetical protein [Magnetococcales bacterium]MBF0172838.1 hypothetical protein [Magnetococcales bacterium]MBF0347662.1 hypothetical protein [Magnetococcales bacterium]MBF0631237.1 hypothetical protein [Magnetococcales bacterium]